MNEIQRIEYNNSGESPKGLANIVKVVGIDNPKEVLYNFKEAVKAILKHPKLGEREKKWERILPEKIVSFIKKLDDEDYSNDDILAPIHSMIDDMRDADIRDWEWYSSKLMDNSFEVVVQGKFHIGFLWFIHCQGIPLYKMFISDGEKTYPIKMYRDVTSYKTFE